MDTCPGCGRTNEPFLIPVIDQAGSTAFCALCVVAELPRWVLSGDLTLLLSRQVALPQK